MIRPQDILTVEGLRALDAKARDLLGIPEHLFIENAARGVLEVMEEKGLPGKDDL